MNELRMRREGESICAHMYLLETKCFLLFLDPIPFSPRSGPVIVLYFGALLSQTLVYQIFGIVAGARSFVHKALCMAFFESGDDLRACWTPQLDQWIKK